MSGFLAGKVWHSALPTTLKPLAAVLADCANDDGSSVYPTIAYIAWLLGAGESTVHRGMKALRKMGVIELVKGGDGVRANEYRLVEAVLPSRPPWRGGVSARRRGPRTAPVDPRVRVPRETPHGCQTEYPTGAIEGAVRVPPAAPNPSVVPASDPPGDPPAPLEPHYEPFEDDGPGAGKRAGNKKPRGDVQTILTEYPRIYAEHHDGDRPVMNYARDGHLAGQLLDHQSVAVILDLAQDFMRIPSDQFLAKAGRGFPIFHTRFNALAAARRRRINGEPEPGSREAELAYAAEEGEAIVRAHLARQQP